MEKSTDKQQSDTEVAEDKAQKFMERQKAQRTPEEIAEGEEYGAKYPTGCTRFLHLCIRNDVIGDKCWANTLPETFRKYADLIESADIHSGCFEGYEFENGNKLVAVSYSHNAFEYEAAQQQIDASGIKGVKAYGMGINPGDHPKFTKVFLSIADQYKGRK